jgi:hypothetical protein
VGAFVGARQLGSGAAPLFGYAMLLLNGEDERFRTWRRLYRKSRKGTAGNYLGIALDNPAVPLQSYDLPVTSGTGRYDPDSDILWRLETILVQKGAMQ